MSPNLASRVHATSAVNRRSGAGGIIGQLDSVAVVLGLIGLSHVATPAYAYIDPGTGGVLVQLVTGGVAGLLILLRLYWHKLRSLLGLPDMRRRDADSTE